MANKHYLEKTQLNKCLCCKLPNKSNLILLLVKTGPLERPYLFLIIIKV